MMKRIIFPTILSGLLWFSAQAQFIQVPFDDTQWDLTTAETTLEEYEGRSSLKLSRGAVFLKNLKFLNGTIEVDVNFPGQRNFFGIFFRSQDEDNHEHFYLRPHQSGQPDACQYTPVFNGISGWQLYHGEDFGTPLDLSPGKWHRLRIVVKGNSASVYYDDMEKPALEIPTLKGDFPAGTLGLNAGQAVHFANFRYSLDDNSYPTQVSAPASDPAVVTSWQLSNVQSNELFQNVSRIDQELKGKLSWKKFPTEPTGLMNIARHAKASEGKTTVVAKLEIPADKDQIKGLAFGYSDEVLVFVNGRLQYAGQNNYTSRDYRYLGTIGYFDAVFLDLKKGDNEVWLVVKENFGGWGVMAKWME